MAKSIKIDDSVYDLLKGMADRDFRTVSQQIAFLINYYEKNKSQNPKNGSGSQANNQRPNGERLVATGDRAMPVRESLPDDLEEALYHFKKISEDLKPEALMRWCHKQSVDEAWTDEQAKIEVDKRKQELLAERDEVAAILKENGVSIGM